MARPSGGYRNAADEPVPGSSTIAKIPDEPAGLIGWAGKTCYEAGRKDFKNGVARKWNDVLYGQRDKAAAIGTVAHDMAEAYITGEHRVNDILETSELTKNGMKRADTAFKAFHDWYLQTKLTIVSTEEPLVSEDYQFGGTFDALGHNTETDSHEIIDYKTSNKLYPSMLLQIRSYGHLQEECKGIVISGYHLCRFDKNKGDFAHYYFKELDDAWKAFKHALKLYDLMKELKKRV